VLEREAKESIHDEVLVSNLLHQIVQGLVYLHDKRLLHGDLKASNVLLQDNGQAYLTNFA
jgi:serine/threonine protein kinase